MNRSEKLLQTIQERGLQPKPGWRFALSRVGGMGVFVVSVVLGALAFSVVLFAIQQTDFNVLQHLKHSRLELWLGLLPLLWIAFMAVFVGLSMVVSRRTGKGYKLTWQRLAIWSFGLSILMGTAFFISGGAARIEGVFASRVELYESIQDKKMRIWSFPEEGYFAGTIESVGDSTLFIHDFKGTRWTIDITGAFVPPLVALRIGERVKFVGKMTAPASFTADQVRPWGGQGVGWDGPGGPR